MSTSRDGPGGRWELLTVLLFAFLAAVIAVLGTLQLPRQYVATVVLLVQAPKQTENNETLVSTAQALTTSTPVLGDLAASSGSGLTPQQIGDRLRVERASGSGVLQLTVTDTSRGRAVAVADQLVPAIQLRLLETRTAAEPATAKIVVKSFSDDSQVESLKPELAKNGALGGTAGLGAAVLLSVADRASRRGRSA